MNVDLCFSEKNIRVFKIIAVLAQRIGSEKNNSSFPVIFFVTVWNDFHPDGQLIIGLWNAKMAFPIF